jgi:hypothetical protein
MVIPEVGVASETNLSSGRRYVLGYKTTQEGADYYRVNARLFPLTADGWGEAWGEFERLEPENAAAYRAKVPSGDTMQAGKTVQQTLAVHPSTAHAGTVDGWSYIFGGGLIEVVGLILAFVAAAPWNAVGGIAAFIGAALTLIGVIAEGVKLGLRDRPQPRI